MLFLFISSCVSSLTCRSPTGSSVPWFAAFKVPKVKDRIPTHENGLGYFYRDDNTRLVEGPDDLNETNGGSNPIYESLRPMYDRRHESTIGYALFSDQPPDGSGSASGSRAHLKGVMVFDDDNAIYLVHSVPKFPPPPLIPSNEYSYPSNGVNNGQSFLCMTIEHSELDKIAESYLLEFPYIYDSKEPSFTGSELPNVHKLLNNQWNKDDVKYVADIKTKTKTIKLFGKSNKFGLDIYHDLIAPGLKTDTYSSTWSNGVGTMNSNCSGSYSAYNVLNVNFGSIEWQRSKDHSKWAVAGSRVCIGGINRQKSQMSRGGDAFCIDFPKFAEEIMGTITEYEQCQ